MGENKENKISLGTAICLAIIFILLIGIIGLFYYFNMKKVETSKENTNNEVKTSQVENVNTTEINKSNATTTNNREPKYVIKNGLSDFDLSFLQIENTEKNKIYSPLSIKYALKMLEEGAKGESKQQISNLLGKYNLTTYTSNKNMSLANALFIKDTYKNSVRQSYIDTLKNKYDAEVKLDSFANAKNMNSWISDKTLKLIENMIDDEIPENQIFYLINALGIDMEWEKKFLNGYGSDEFIGYAHENYNLKIPGKVSSNKFDDEKQTVSGMKIEATANKYDIVKEIGEESIKKTVGDEYRKFLNEYESYLSSEQVEEKIKNYLPNYIKEINENYKKVDVSSEFSFYTDNDVKVFAKDLKEYGGTTLQYVGIMPTTENLESYTKNVNATKINNILSKLKEIKLENFKDGVVTKITGFIPKFKFEYDLDLMEDLKKIGITDIFDKGKADLSGIMENNDNLYIDTALHKANIEFTQDGIKAAAVTVLGGLGAGGDFDYLYDVPTEEIDLTFDKPYMFLIRDKETQEIWFAGTVYEPLSWENEPDKGAFRN